MVLHKKVLKRSVLGLVEVWNLLPTAVVEGSKTVQSFQAQLQELTLTAARDGFEDWKVLLNADRSYWERRGLRLERLKKFVPTSTVEKTREN